MQRAIKQRVSRRLNIIQGQLKGLAKMIDKETYCVDIITQSRAVREALSGVEDLMLENHLATHVLQQMRTGKEKKAIEEIVRIYALAQKKK